MIDEISKELEIVNSLKFKDIDEFAKYYYEISRIEKKVKTVKDYIKRQGKGMIYDSPDEIKRLEYDNFIITNIGASESINYNPKNVIEVMSEILSPEFAWSFVDTKNAKVKQMLTSLIMNSAITQEQVDKLNNKSTKKRRSGFIQLREITNNKFIR